MLSNQLTQEVVVLVFPMWLFWCCDPHSKPDLVCLASFPIYKNTFIEGKTLTKKQ